MTDSISLPISVNSPNLVNLPNFEINPKLSNMLNRTFSSELVDLVDYSEYGDLELTRCELEEILGQSPNSNLSNRIFDFTDKDKNGHVCAREFADILILLLKEQFMR